MRKTTRLCRCIKPVLTVALLAGIAAHPGCSGERDPATLFGPAERETVVVDAVLYVDRSLPEIIVSRTRTADAVSSGDATAVNDAEVTVIQGLAEYRYASIGHLGRYLPPHGAPKVLPNTEYRLRVRALARKSAGLRARRLPW